MKRVFLVVLDSFGVGALPDAADYGDSGSNTLRSVSQSRLFVAPNLIKLGLMNIDGVNGEGVKHPTACYARLKERSKGKDTTIGHWELAGVVTEQPLRTYPDGFPPEVIEEFERLTGRRVLCNKPYSGTEVIKVYGEESVRTGSLIVYTSADSVFQIAAHEEVIPVAELYRYCELARKMFDTGFNGAHKVGRIIARPFIGADGVYTRTARRHDFSIAPPSETMLDRLAACGVQTVGIGKINDIFAGRGLTAFERTADNADGIEKTVSLTATLRADALCFINLVDFDMKYGHRNDADGYARAISEFDAALPRIVDGLKTDDILIITADHGCDPSTASTDHSREYVPMLAYGKKLKSGVNLGTRTSFADLAATILEYFDQQPLPCGSSFLKEILYV